MKGETVKQQIQRQLDASGKFSLNERMLALGGAVDNRINKLEDALRTYGNGYYIEEINEVLKER